MSSTAVQIFPPEASADPAPEAQRSARRVSPRTIVLLLIAISAAYVGWHLYGGWIPHDDGAIAQSADRLLNGQLPHRDFDDIYTGGLSYLNAAAFALLGTSLATLRIPLFVAFLAWVPAVYYIASRFVRPYGAAALTLLAVVWTLPNYPAAMPSWYNLFLATFGVAALFRYLETGRRGWIAAAGTAGGLSVLVKVIGLYNVAAVLLFLVFRAHTEARAANAQRSNGQARGYALFVSVSLALFVLVVVRVIGDRLHVGEAIQFVLPPALLAVLIARQEWTEAAGGDAVRFRALGRLLLPFFAGLVPPIVLFLIPYIVSGSVGALVYGVFVLPMKRFGFAAVAVGPLWTMLACAPLVALALLAIFVRGRWATVVQVVAGVCAAALIVGTMFRPSVRMGIWYSLRSFLPLLVIVATAVLWRARASDREHPPLRSYAVAVLSMTAVTNLVQFPFTVAIYYCYVAPLVFLSAAALLPYAPRMHRAAPAIASVFYLLFGLVDVNGEGVWQAKWTMPYQWYTERLAIPRGGILVTPFDARTYALLIPMLQVHAHGGYIWASRDCPEVYFLSGLKNPTRTLFDFFDDTTNYDARILKMLDDRHITAIVMNRYPQFSPQFTKEFAAVLFQRFPYAANVGRYHLRWRE